MAVVAELPEIQLFNRWSCDDVHVADMSLQVVKCSYKLQCPPLISRSIYPVSSIVHPNRTFRRIARRERLI